MTARNSSSRQRAALAMAFGRAVEWLGGGVVATTLTRVKPPLLSAYGSPDNEDRYAPIDVALDLDLEFVRRGQRPPLFTAYAGLLTAAGNPSEAGAVTLGDFRQLSRQVSELADELLASIDDGSVTETERRRCLAELADVRAELDRIERKLTGV